MTNRKETGTEQVGPHLVDYFHGVDVFSSEHLRDIARFTRLLESMNTPRQDKSDRRSIAELRSILSEFREYLGSHNLLLTETERRELSAITGSRISAAVKKRLAEDLVHKVRQRDERVQQTRKDQLLADEEIRQLALEKKSLVRWFRLTKFALDFGTITLFTHQVKASTIDHIRNDTYAWQQALQESIRGILDRDYYLLTTLEYNSLAVIPELGDPIEGIREIPARAVYRAADLTREMDAFAAAYITILKNSILVEATFQKVFKNRKTAHGLYGILRNLLDQPIFNNKPRIRSGFARISESVFGAVLSYYSAREGVVIRTYNQILYLLHADGTLDDMGKHLTPAATRLEQESRRIENTDEQRVRDKFTELERITESYLPGAPSTENRIYRIEGGPLHQAWETEHQTRPILRLKRLAEGFIRHFTEFISGDKEFLLEYDNKPFPHYFRIRTGIIDAAAYFNLLEFEMTGLKAIEIGRIAAPAGISSLDYIKKLTRPDALPAGFSPSENFVQSLVVKLGNRSFHLAIQLNDLITEYYNQKAILHPDVEFSYDFLINATVKPVKNMKTHLVLKKNFITLLDFIESACAIAFFIARECNHSGIKSIFDEKEALKPEYDRICAGECLTDQMQKEIIPLEQQAPEDPEHLNRKIASIYLDSLTGLYRREYLEDVLLPELYDEEFNYFQESPRFVFSLQIDNFSSFNEVFGMDTGDRILSETAARIREHVTAQGADKNNVVIRHRGGEFIGYINNTTIFSAVEILEAARKELGNLSIFTPTENIGQISFSAGIYQERTGTNIYENIMIAEKMASYVSTLGGGKICFTRNQNLIVTRRDFDQQDGLNPELLSVLHSTGEG